MVTCTCASIGELRTHERRRWTCQASANRTRKAKATPRRRNQANEGAREEDRAENDTEAKQRPDDRDAKADRTSQQQTVDDEDRQAGKDQTDADEVDSDRLRLCTRALYGSNARLQAK